MSFAISGTNYGIATQEEAYACGLVNTYTTSNGNKRLLSTQNVLNAYNQNVKGPSYWKFYSDIHIPTKTNMSKDLFTFGPLRDIYGSNNLEVTIESSINITFDDGCSVSVVAYNPSRNVATPIYALSGLDLNALLTRISSALSGDSFTRSCDFNNKVGELLHYEDTVVGLYFSLPVYEEVELTFGYLAKDRLVTGKSFQSYNITRPWDLRISETKTGSVKANTITAQYRYSNSTNVPNSMTIKDFLSRGSGYFGDSISGGKTVSVNLPVNRFYILGRTGSLSSLPTYDKLTFWCGETSVNNKWTGQYAQRSSGTLVGGWKNSVTLSSSGKSVIHGNDSQDAPFYSWNFLQAINNAYGVNFSIAND